MNRLIIFFSVLFLISCSSSSYLLNKSTRHSFLNHSEMVSKINKTVDNHSELTENQKGDLKSTLVKALEVSQTLKIKESQLAQEYLETTFNGISKSKMDKFNNEFIKLYKRKIENFNDTSLKLKSIIQPEYQKSIFSEYMHLRKEWFSGQDRF